MMWLITSKRGKVYFDKTDEAHNGNECLSLRKRFVNNPGEVDNRVRIKGHLPLEHVFGVCRTLYIITKNLGFHLYFKTADFWDLIYTTSGSDFIITNDSLFLYIPTFLLDASTQSLLKGSIKSSFTLKSDS